MAPRGAPSVPPPPIHWPAGSGPVQAKPAAHAGAGCCPPPPSWPARPAPPAPPSIQRKAAPAAVTPPQPVHKGAGEILQAAKRDFANVGGKVPEAKNQRVTVTRGTRATTSNKPWVSNGEGQYGIRKRLTRGQAFGTTGGAQTTYLDCSINGSFFGKFANKLDDHFKKNKGISSKPANEVGIIKRKRWKNYPDYCIRPANWNNDDHNDGAPHAEDLLIMALTAAHTTSPGVFTRYGTPIGGKAPLLSIRINNTPCERCAKNLIRVCSKLALSLRVKGTFLFEAAAPNPGTSFLHAAGVPVRQWRTTQIDAKTVGRSAGKRRLSITDIGYFDTARGTALESNNWTDPHKRATLDNSGSIGTYATDQLHLA